MKPPRRDTSRTRIPTFPAPSPYAGKNAYNVIVIITIHVNHIILIIIIIINVLPEPWMNPLRIYIYTNVRLMGYGFYFFLFCPQKDITFIIRWWWCIAIVLLIRLSSAARGARTLDFWSAILFIIIILYMMARGAGERTKLRFVRPRYRSSVKITLQQCVHTLRNFFETVWNVWANSQAFRSFV